MAKNSIQEIDSNLVSICIPSHNSSQFINKTIDSLLNQSYKNLEIIIIDDHSSDNSFKLIKDYALKDDRIKFQEAVSKGAAAARNQAYLLSKGNYIVFFDADDWIPEQFIQTQLQSIKDENEVVVSCWGRFYDDDLNTLALNPNQIKSDLSFENWVRNYWIDNSHMTCPGRVMITRQLVEKSGLWNEDLSLNDDFEFFTRIFSESKIIRFNEKTIFYYRSGINGLSSKKNLQAYKSLHQSLVLSIKIAQSRLKSTPEIKLCFANLLQNFIYESYPLHKELIQKTKKEIKQLGGSNLPFPAGGITKFLLHIVGWKLTKRLKILLNKQN